MTIPHQTSPEKLIHFEYSLHQQKLEQVQSAKYIGITISYDGNLGKHITEIPCMATKTLCFLRRSMTLAPRHTKEVAYKTLVCSQIEHATPFWHSYHETQIGRVKKEDSCQVDLQAMEKHK